MEHVIMKAEGYNGDLEMTESLVRIKRKGFLTLLAQGFKGDKEIMISEISSIQYKAPSFFVNGYIQFAFRGGREALGGLFEAAADENTVMFKGDHESEFSAFKEELQKRIVASREVGISSKSSDLDDLEKLGSLRDRKIVSEEEFQAKKRKILGI